MTVRRDRGPRWFSWINVSDTVIPPWAVIAITGSRIVDTRIVFEGDRLPEDPITDPLPSWQNGVPWNAAFNDHRGVEIGAEGKLTVDLPAWCLITESLMVMDFASYNVRGTGQRFSLLTLPPNLDVESPLRFYWPGFHVLATRYIPEFHDIWNAKAGHFLQGNFKIGFVGGLATDVLAFDQVQP